MLADRGKPAALKFGSGNCEFAILAVSPLEAVIHTLLGEVTYNPRAYENSDNNNNEESDNAFFHDQYPERCKRAGDASMQPGAGNETVV